MTFGFFPRRTLPCLITAVLCTLPQLLFGQKESLLNELDNTLRRKPEIIKLKEARIDSLRRQCEGKDASGLFDLYNQILNEYKVYQADSVMLYARRMQDLTAELNDDFHVQQAIIARIYALAAGGYYGQVEDAIDELQPDKLDPRLIFHYNYTLYWVYVYSEAYCNDNVFAPRYAKLKGEYLQKSLEHCSRNNLPLYHIIAGDCAYWFRKDTKEAMKHYMEVVKICNVSDRLYAMSAYALYRIYHEQGNKELSDEWLIRSAISDQASCTMEYVSLQDLAIDLFNESEDNAKRASRYIVQAMEDTRFSGNKLRSLDISKKMPGIVTVYQRQLEDDEQSLRTGTIVLGVLIIIIMLFFMRLWGFNRATKRKNEMIRKQNDELANLNSRLVQTDTVRERYSRLLIDFCAMYINKLTEYRKLVTRKIKVHQEQELLNMAPDKLTSQEQATFNKEFDHGFLRLFPDFIEEFNKLLLDDEQIKIDTMGSLTTELRIYALIRVGVVESSVIATLLFYSPQTIYNYRTATKRKARNKDTFEADVMNLCRIQ